MIHKFIKEESVIEPEKVQTFGEYRKGSGKFGSLIQSIMMWLRHYRKDNSNRINTSLTKFLEETKISQKELEEFLQESKQTNLISFDIEIQGDQIIFNNLNNTTKNRYVWENIQEDSQKIIPLDLTELIKNYLVQKNEENSWEDFVDGQKMGDCQLICSQIKQEFSTVKHYIGEIEVEEYYDHEHDEYTNKMVHHWITINNQIYDFSKGSIQNHVEIIGDIYDPEIIDDNIYHSFYEIKD